MILITGSQGFIGNHLIKSIPESIGLDNTDRGKAQNYISVDLRDYDDVFWALKDKNISCVLHNAAVPSVPKSYKDPMGTYSNNVVASINLIKVCKILNIKKFIFASSSSVNGPSPYGHSKKVIEDVLKHSGINYTVLRYFNVYGEGQRENIVSIMLDAIKNNGEIIINGDGSTSRDFTHVSNVVRASLKAIDEKYNGMILDVGTGKSHTLNQLYKRLKNNINPEHNKVVYGPLREGDILYSQADSFLNEEEITSFEKGIDSL